MEDHTNIRQLIVPLTKSHPIFTLDEPKRNQFIKEMLDQSFPSPATFQNELAQLNAKVDTMAAKMELVQDVLETVIAIKKTMEKSADGKMFQEKIIKSKEHSSEQTKVGLPSENTKQVKFDVDAFLELG